MDKQEESKDFLYMGGIQKEIINESDSKAGFQ